MYGEAALSPREQEILHSIVRAYIQTGEPVSSRAIAHRPSQRLSPASIRNVMAALADEGYLSQPHTSAGRVPTEKAFRCYVRSLNARPSPAEAERVRVQLSAENTVVGRLERSSRILTEWTLHVGIAAAMPSTAQVLDHIELLSVADRRVLMILVTRGQMVHDRVVMVAEQLSQDELNSLRNYVNHHFSGWNLGDARRELSRRFDQERAAYDAILRRLTVLCQKGLLDVDEAPEVRMEGASNLVSIDLHLTRERMRDLFRTLEEKKRLIELLDRFLEQPPGKVAVHVGLEDAHPAMKELALIGMAFSLPSGMLARVAVLGPMRMHYERAISAVLHIGRAFESLPV
jgi:heat-inducible transcriptional repressor